MVQDRAVRTMADRY